MGLNCVAGRTRSDVATLVAACGGPVSLGFNAGYRSWATSPRMMLPPPPPQLWMRRSPAEPPTSISSRATWPPA
eukprot:1330883-Alexandrium_andersonii.AAC.1